MGFRLGWGGILEKLKKYRKINTGKEHEEFYECEIRIVEAIIDFLKRMAERCV